MVLSALSREVGRFFFKSKTEEMNVFRSIRHYKQNGRMAPLTPRSIQIQTQSACNGQCVYCPYPVVSRDVPQGKMAWETFVRIADEITKWPYLERVDLMLQNEPLLDQDLFKMVRYLKSIKPVLWVGTVTNGTLLDKTKAEEMAESGLDEIRISIDAFTKETYEELHPGFAFENVLEVIDLIGNIKREQFSKKASFVLTKKNAKELNAFVRYMHLKGFRWETIYLLNRSNNVKDYDLLRLSKNTWRYWKLHMMYRYFYATCPMPFIDMSVLFNGDVIICCQDWRRQIVMGNIRSSSLLDIWDSDVYNALRHKIAELRFNEVKTCAACTLAELSR